MPSYAIIYTLKKNKNYPPLWNAVKGWNAVRILDSTWLADLTGPAATIRNILLGFVDDDDDIVVIELKPGLQLDALRQPLENGTVLIARANHHVTYPARIMLAAAMNPCRCGGGPGAGMCRRGPRCAIDYQARPSGPLLDRIDIQLDVPPVTAADLALPPPPEGTAEAAGRVAYAREAQASCGKSLNAGLDLDALERVASPDSPGAALLSKAAETLALSARAYHRTLKTARTIADLDGADSVKRIHVAERLSLRRQWAGAEQGGLARVS